SLSGVDNPTKFICVCALRLYFRAKSLNFTPAQCVIWLHPSIHLKSKTRSVLGKDFISARVIKRVSPLLSTRCSFQLLSNALFIPISPLTLTCFTASETGYVFAR